MYELKSRHLMLSFMNCKFIFLEPYLPIAILIQSATESFIFFWQSSELEILLVFLILQNTGRLAPLSDL